MKQNLNEFLDLLNEYISVIQNGKIDMDELEFLLISLDSKDKARRLAFRLLKTVSPAELKKAKALKNQIKNVQAQWFFDALDEKVPSLTKVS